MKRGGLLIVLIPLMTLPFRSAAAQTGEFRVNAGLASGVGSDGLPPTVATTASFSFVKSSFSLGPEVLYVGGSERIFGIGAVARLYVGSGTLRPYLIGGLGGNYWKRQQFVTAGLFSGSLGAGLSVATRGALGVGLEARLNKNLQRYGGGGNWDFVTVMAGVRLGW